MRLLRVGLAASMIAGCPDDVDGLAAFEDFELSLAFFEKCSLTTCCLLLLALAGVLLDVVGCGGAEGRCGK